MTTESPVLLELHDGVARITLNRPHAYNALSLELVEELERAAMQCDGNADVRAIVLSGAGHAFCAGGDLKDFASRGSEMPRILKEVTSALHTAISLFARMDPPVIAAVHGSAAGAGMSLACACDLVVAAQSARFNAAYTRVGLTPDGSLSYFLPRLVGRQRTLDLILTNRTLSATEAQEWGIVTTVVPDDELMDRAMALAHELAVGPTSAFGAGKRLLEGSWSVSLETQMALETRSIANRARTADGQEGIAAFIEKRPPRFEGR